MWQRVGAFVLGGIVSAAFLGACGDDLIAPVCTLEARASLMVQVVDSVSGAVIPEPTVWVKDGAFVDTLRVREGVAAGPYERAGTYDVHVEETGFAPWVLKGVEVTENRCHVETRELTARLQPTN